MKSFKLLPSVYQNDVNKSLYENIFDKFTSDNNMVNLSGVVGEGTYPNKIPEFSDYRTNNQIQPQMVSNVGSQTQLTSFEDFMQVLSSWGVDLSKFDAWGKLDSFSLHPPFDLHKFNNYGEYYWMANTAPDYVTIKNRYIQLTHYVSKKFSQFPRLEPLSKLAYIAQTESYIRVVDNIVPGFFKVYREYMEYVTNDPANFVSENGWDNVQWDVEVYGTWDDVVDGLQILSYQSDTITFAGNVEEIFTYSNPFQFEIFNGGLNDGMYSSFAAYYDVDSNTTIVDLDRSIDPLQPIGKVLIGNFDFTQWDPEADTDGHGWDENVATDVPVPEYLQRDDWSVNNKWVHISNIPASVNLSTYHKAIMPIIEFDPYVELNEWVQIVHKWNYGNGSGEYAVSDSEPTLDEINSHMFVETPDSLLLSNIIVSSSLASKIRRAPQIAVELVQSGTFIYPTIVQEYDNGITSVFVTNYSFESVDPSEIRVHPLRYSSKGDDWKGFTSHWELRNDYEFVPIGNQVDASLKRVIPIQGMNSTVYDLGIQYKSNTNEIRVYVNGRRQYGNYVEGNIVSGTFVESLTPENCTAVKFDEGLGAGNITVHYGHHVAEDAGRKDIPVRLQNGQTVITHLLTKIKFEQIKSSIGQYPEFNAYDHHGMHSGSTTKIWKYVRVESAPVNVYINDRVDLQFANELVDPAGVKTYVRKRDYWDDPMYIAGAWKRVDAPTPVKVGSDWDLPGYFKYNPAHVDRHDYLFKYTLAHFSRIVDSQPVHWVDTIDIVPVLGSIREYNNNVDWLWSHIHRGLPSIPSIIGYARESYARGVQTVKRLSQESIDTSTLINPSTLYAAVKKLYSVDDNLLKFGDTTSPIPNFPSTPVTLKWVPRVRPDAISVQGGWTITHHDGHKSIIKLTDFEISEITTRLKMHGVMVHNDFPSVSGYSSGDIVIHGTHAYRLKSITNSTINPTAQLAPGTCWYNSTLDKYFIGTQNGNLEVPGLKVWEQIDYSKLVAETIVSLETELYNEGVDTVDGFSAPQDMSYKVNEFVRSSKLDPSITTDYDITNPFTWNYKSQFPQSPRWYTIYENMYNTRYPNLEPWKLQGYTLKPSWWDSEYKDFAETRLWIPIMWTNIKTGVVPTGRALPDGTVSNGSTSSVTPVPVIPVNTTNNTQEFGLDELLPPYFYSSDPVLSAEARLSNPIPTSEASKPYLFGERGPLEDIWARSNYFIYDCITVIWTRDPINRMSDWIGIERVTTPIGLNVGSDGSITPYNKLPHHGDVIDGKVYQYKGLYQWLAHKLRFDAVDYDFNGYRDKQQAEIKFTYPVSGFIDSSTASVIKRTTLNYDNNITYDVMVKESQITDTVPLTSFRCIISKVGGSEVVKGLRIPTAKGDDWVYTILASNPYLTEIRLYEPVDVTESTFSTSVNDRDNTWRVLGTSDNVITYRFGTPLTDAHPLFGGIEGVIAFINSYEKFIIDNGYVTDHEIDQLNSGASWGMNVFDFITNVYQGMGSSSVVPFIGTWSHVVPLVGTNKLNILGQANKFKVGQKVQFHTTGRLPSSLDLNEVYVITNTTTYTVTIEKVNGAPVTISNIGQGFISIGVHRIEVATPISHFEFNPHQTAIKIRHPKGLLSKVGVNVTQDTLVYDQYGDIISTESVQVLRTDDESVVKIKPNVLNVKMQQRSTIGSVVPKFKTVEHVIVFNDTSVDGEIWFDPSLGSFVQYMTLSGKVHRDNTFKPTIGGAFISEGRIVNNVKSSAESHTMMYDTASTTNEELTKYARKLIGFEPQQYMTDIGITDDTQLSFYQEAIKSKGLLQNITNFVNSKFYLDAKIDEWWAYKTGSFGSSNVPVYQDIPLSGSTKYGDVAILNVTDTTLIDPLYNSDNYRSRFDIVPNVSEVIKTTPTNRVVRTSTQFDAVEIYYDVEQTEATTSYNNSNVVPINFIGTFTSYEPVVYYKNVVQDVKNYSTTANSVTFVTITDGNGNTVTPVRGDLIRVVYKPRKLVDGIDYVSYPGAKYVLMNVLNRPLVVYVMTVNSAASPIQLVKDGRLADYIELWDPAAGLHSNEPLENVKYVSTVDIAHYTNSLVTTDIKLARNWGSEHVGEVWWNTSKLFYKPYHEYRLYNGDGRVKAWGELAEFAAVELCEWVESSVTPDKYTEYNKKSRKVAKPVEEVTYRVRTSSSAQFGPWKKDLMSVVECNGYEYTNRMLQNNVISLAPGRLDMFVNGVSVWNIENANEWTFDVYGTGVTVDNTDVIHFVKTPRVLTPDELKFDPSVRDDGRLIHYKYHTPYVTRTMLNELNVPVDTYYFWAINTETQHSKGNLKRLERSLINHDNQFAFMSDYMSGKYNTVTMIGVSSVSDDHNVRFVQQPVLEMTEPDTFSEWKMIRLNDKTNVPKALWTKLVEAMVGFKLVNGQITSNSVPHLDVLFWDQQHGTNLRYGLGLKQAMCPMSDVYEVVNSVLLDPTINLYPIDRDVFRRQYNTDTVQNTVEMMEAIYNTFTPEAVNTIWFKSLYAGLAANVDYEGIMKTSYIQVTSVQSISETGT